MIPLNRLLQSPCTRFGRQVGLSLALALLGAIGLEAGATPAATRLYFGELHLHTAHSLDSYIFGNTHGPEAALRFAQGEALTLYGGATVRLQQPLDFVAITDHAEYMGELFRCTQAGSGSYESQACLAIRQRDLREFAVMSASVTDGERRAAICGDHPENCSRAAANIWRDTRAVAERHNRPGEFTTLLGFEFSDNIPRAPSADAVLASRAPGMLHRNVIFGSATVPDTVFSAYEGSGEDLWRWLDATCTGACRALTIPHNSNYSWGRFFWSDRHSDGSAWDEQTLKRRARLERLVEIFQIKGSSECQVGVGLADEDCNFELTVAACEPGQSEHCAGPDSFLRNALVKGLDIRARLGFNPFQFGFVAATDNHNGTPGAVVESQFNGHLGQQDYRPEQRLGLDAGVDAGGAFRLFNPGGLTGVWAQENTRSAIWDALYRREVFATSGPRIGVRFFAGYDVPEDIHERTDRDALAYAMGVPMGGEMHPLAEPQPGQVSPVFALWANRDPQSNPLQKLQIVKGLVVDGELAVRVYDVACSDGLEPDAATARCPPSGAEVDASNCRPRSKRGAAALATSWRDPDFDPRQRAVYYVRVFETPSCRWTHYDALRLGREKDLPLETVQERAWTSPIWFEPQARQLE
ncbi:DUF3604 domain-containing protein [Parahaliea mediterranea]|uniref:DUF3604 domain-containing protein n=1 Tax=Parahaliea mediterranea TaxID=651086 RepID=UPI00240D8EAA|nr:DUF3604 domain-containing protein [Parahaliea mediterranea]